MNKLIENKKGNIGFYVGSWNQSYDSVNKDHVNTTTISDSRFKLRFTLLIEKVKIHSCGKKVMRLHSEDKNESMKRHEYNPKSEIFTTEQGAYEAAMIHLGKVKVKFLTRYKDEYQKVLDRDLGFSNEIGKAIHEEDLTRMKSLMARIENGQIELRPLRYNLPDSELFD